MALVEGSTNYEMSASPLGMQMGEDQQALRVCCGQQGGDYWLYLEPGLAG